MWSYVLSDLNWAHFLTLNIKKYYIKKVPVYCRSNDRKQFYIHLLRYFWYWLVIRSDKSKYIWITWWFVCRIPSSKPVYACIRYKSGHSKFRSAMLCQNVSYENQLNWVVRSNGEGFFLRHYYFPQKPSNSTAIFCSNAIRRKKICHLASALFLALLY